MLLTRLRRVIELEIIRPLLLDDPDYDQKTYMDSLRVKLEQEPDSVMIPVCLQDDEVIGYTITYKNYDQPFAWMAMAWIKPGVGSKVGRALQNATITWCENKGINEIRAETKRDEVRAMERYGFKELAKIVSLRWEI
jgi:hypothetical protein